MLKAICLFIFCAFGLAACGGGGTGDPIVDGPPPPPPPMSQEAYAQLVAADDANILRIAGDLDAGLRGIPGTNWSSVPVAGEALFLGLGQGTVADMTFRGDAVLTVNFSGDDITGGLRNIVGDDGERTWSTDGTLVLSNGDLRLTRPTDFSVDYAGTLDFDDNVYELDGTMTGLLRGTRIGVSERSPIKALSAVDDNGTALVNGVDTDATLTIVAESR